MPNVMKVVLVAILGGTACLYGLERSGYTVLPIEKEYMIIAVITIMAYAALLGKHNRIVSASSLVAYAIVLSPMLLFKSVDDIPEVYVTLMSLGLICGVVLSTVWLFLDIWRTVQSNKG